MSSLPQQPSFRFPFVLTGHPKEIQDAHVWAFNAIQDLQNANAVNVGKISKLKASVPTTVGGSTSTSITVNSNAFSGLGAVRDETGQTAYTIIGADNGILLILNDASPVAVTLDSAMVTPFFILATNFGAGVATLTPTSGTINGGASLTLLQGQLIWVVFTGVNWQTGAFTTPPQNTPAITHEFITAFNAATGIFSQAQPDFTDISGQITTSQLPVSGVSVTITTAALTGLGTQGSMTFTNGILTAQTPAT
jgi:hypothetical protein